MSQRGDETIRKPGAVHPAHRAGRWFVAATAIVAVVLLVVGLGLTGRVIPAPGWVVERIEARANAALAGEVSARIGGLELTVDERFVPHVRMSDVELFSKSGTQLALLPDIRTTLKAAPVLKGRLEPRSLRIKGARIALRRLEDGRFDIAVGVPGMADDAAANVPAAALSPSDLLQAVDDAFTLPVLKDIERIEIDQLNFSLDDQRTKRVWTTVGGWLTLTQTADLIEIEIGTELANAGRAPARAEARFRSVKRSPEASLAITVNDVPSRDLAAQSPALTFLAALDAPISGSVETGVAADGHYEGMSAVLEIGAGAIRPTADIRPVRFDHVRLAMSYDPDAARLDFSDIAVESRALRITAGATALLKDFDGAWPETLLAQVAIRDLKADPEGVFADPVTFSQGALDFRLRLDPFRLDIGQFVLVDGPQRIAARGEVRAEPDGWDVAVDVAVNEITSSRLLALWPVVAVPRTREWLEENVATSGLFDVTSAFRLRPGGEPHFSLGWEYRDTEVRVLKTLPPIQDGAGYATINDYSYTLVVDRGHVVSPVGGDIDVAGSVMAIADLRIVPAPARFTLRTDSTITAALSLLDQPPFEFLSKSGKPVDLAEGRAQVEAVLDLRLAQKIGVDDVGYNVTGVLLDVRSDRIAPGRDLTAGRLDLVATREGIEISGPATFSGVPVDAVWRQRFGPEGRGKSEVEGTVELSQRFLDAFSIGLPPGSLSGSGRGRIVLRIEEGRPVEFRLGSDLAGLGLSIPEIGWTKPTGSTGRLSVAGRLGEPPEVDLLEIDAPGLSVSGTVKLAPDGALEAVRLPAARAGDWFDGSVELRGRGKGLPVAVVVTGGSADLRRANFGAGRQSSAGAPLSIALDRLQVSRTIAVEGFRGDFTTGGGLSGSFTGRINGAAPVTGQVSPLGSRSGFRIRSDDAGGALRAAGIFTRGVGGALDLTLSPRQGSGQYDGTVTINDIRVVNAPALAALLDAVSVVGLLSQLNGPGILFARVSGEFRLTPDAVEIRRGSAVGPSLGISAEGVYQTSSERIDLQGTISPVYLLNSIGQVVSREGEGLFGFNYRLSGPSGSPRVTVNPLSILTPGMFREIFRSRPPKLSQ